MKRKHKSWILLALLVGVSIYLLRQEDAAAALQEELHRQEVTLASPVFLREPVEKQAEPYLYFRTEEFSEVLFKVSSPRYELVDTEIAVEMAVGDRLGIWIRERDSKLSTEREVYGLLSPPKAFLEINEVLAQERRSQRKNATFLLAVVVAVFLYNYFAPVTPVKRE